MIKYTVLCPRHSLAFGFVSRWVGKASNHKHICCIWSAKLFFYMLVLELGLLLLTAFGTISWEKHLGTGSGLFVFCDLLAWFFAKFSWFIDHTSCRNLKTLHECYFGSYTEKSWSLWHCPFDCLRQTESQPLALSLSTFFFIRSPPSEQILVYPDSEDHSSIYWTSTG